MDFGLRQWLAKCGMLEVFEELMRNDNVNSYDILFAIVEKIASFGKDSEFVAAVRRLGHKYSAYLGSDSDENNGKFPYRCANSMLLIFWKWKTIHQSYTISCIP